MSDNEKPDLNSLIEHYGSPTKDRASYMTRCVLHEDRTPSLSVNTTKQVWSCKSCGEGGDSYTLIQKKENCSFTEARSTAQSLGLSVGSGGSTESEVSGSVYGQQRRKAESKRKSTGKYVPAWRRD